MTRGFFNLCPKCKRESVFIGITRLKNSCNQCGLIYRAEEIGDGASYITTFLLCFIITPFLIYIEIKFAISKMFYLLIIFPMTLLLSIGLLRITRYFLLRKILK